MSQAELDALSIKFPTAAQVQDLGLTWDSPRSSPRSHSSLVSLATAEDAVLAQIQQKMKQQTEQQQVFLSTPKKDRRLLKEETDLLDAEIAALHKQLKSIILSREAAAGEEDCANLDCNQCQRTSAQRCMRREWNCEQPAAQKDVLEFVKSRALDLGSLLFRPYIYDRTGVFARQLKSGEKENMKKYDPPHPSEPVSFCFESPPEGLREGNAREVGLSKGDYLGLVVTGQKDGGRVWRVEGSAFAEDGVTRYVKLCRRCKKYARSCECDRNSCQCAADATSCECVKLGIGEFNDNGGLY